MAVPFDPTDPFVLTPEQRQEELCSLFATGLRRLLSFELYLEHQALIPTVTAITVQGWCNKRWITKTGEQQGGRPFDKTTLHRLLTNRTYTGVISYQGQDYPGEHAAIVPASLFDRVQAILRRNGHTKGVAVKNRYGALLKGLLSCACCRCALMHTYSVK